MLRILNTNIKNINWENIGCACGCWCGGTTGDCYAEGYMDGVAQTLQESPC